MANYEPYFVADNGRILAYSKRNLVKIQPKPEDFTSALQTLIPNGIKDAGFSDNDKNLREKVLPKISEIYAANYIYAEEALFLLTGIMPANAAYRFEWEGKVYFTMRPTFGLICIESNFGKSPLNCFEIEIQDRLLGRKKEINAIFQAIEHGDLPSYYNEMAPFEEWTHLFQKRGFDLSHIPQKYLSDPLSVLKNENSVLKANLEQTEKMNHELSTKLHQCEKHFSSAYSDEVNPRSERTYLNIIGALLEICTGRFKDEKFLNETELREFIVDQYRGFRGTSSRTLADKFASAKKVVND